MPWTASARRQYARTATRYTTDLTEAEFALIAPHLPAPSRLGRPRTVSLREVLNAILYLLRTGCPWDLLPKELPAEEHGVRLFPALVGGRNLADAAGQAGHGGARAGRPGGLADRWHHRQPERADHRGRRPQRL